MICVLPQSQAGEFSVSVVDDSITVAAVLRLIILSKREKSILLNSRGRRRLWREVPKHFRAVIDHAITVAVEDKPGIIRTGCSPRQLFFDSVCVQIEHDATGGVSEIE